MNFLALLGIGIALAAPDNETVWWRTDGGTVVGFHDTKECSLLLYDHDHGLVFSWGKGTEKIAVQANNLHFSEGEAVPMAVQIGDRPLGIIPAIGVNDYASGELGQPVENLLRTANQIIVQFMGAEVEFTVNRSKLPALMEGVDKCRKQG